MRTGFSIKNYRRILFRTGVLLLLAGYIVVLPGKLFTDPVSTVILDRNGRLLGAKVAADGQWRFPGRAAVPEKLATATLAFEDRYFYRHPGFNPVSLVRALVFNIRAGKVVSGGSTLTMQTIRMSRKGRPRTVFEKITEIILATRLELNRSKTEILALYLANAPYGGNVVGIGAASWRYFGTNAENLSWAEAATLAVLPNAPALVHPGRNRDLLLKKRDRLLERLYKQGKIDSLTCRMACYETIPERPLAIPRLAPHLLDRFCLESPGNIIGTTLDENLQRNCMAIVQKHHERLQFNEVHNAAVLIAEVETGNVLVYAGNVPATGSDDHGSDVDIIRSERSTGSLLKPLLYAALLDDGKLLPGSLVPDIPINLGGFAPRNFDGLFEGAVRADRALSRSLNVPAVQMLKEFGIERFHHLLGDLGMTTLTKPAAHYGLSLILGGAEGTLEEMTNIYACFSRVLNHFAGTGLYFPGDYRPLNYRVQSPPRPEKGISQPGIVSASALWFTYMAMDEVNRPEEESGWKAFSSSRKIAWKTGTSFGYRDGWAIGTSPDYVVGVWVGNADGEGRPGLTGIAAAAPLLFEIFGTLPRSGWFGAPLDELVSVRVCSKSGYLAGMHCDGIDTVKVQLNGTRARTCPYHRLVHLSRDLEYRVNSNCYPVDSMNHLSWFVLPPVQEWYYKKRHSDYNSLPPFKTGCEPGSQRNMDLIYPHEETKIFIPVELDGKKGRVIFEAVHNDPEATLYWHIDDRFITATHHIHQIEILPDKGKHRLILIDESGEELVKNFELVEN